VTAALEGLRVVDLSHYLAGPQVAMILGDLGANVIRIDPPGGPRWNHPANAMLQRGKRSIVLDLKNGADLEVARRLIHAADVVVENFRPGVADRLGVGPRASLDENPRLVYCSLPGFGESDPRSQVSAWEGVVCAAAGIYVSGTVNPDDAPIFNAVPYASSFGAMVASHSVMAALIARERTGRGQRVEVPLFDALFEGIGHFGVRRLGGPDPMTPNVFGAVVGTSPHGGFYQCADGRWIHLCLIQGRHLLWFAEKLFPQEWIDAGMADPVKMGAVDGDPMIMHGDGNALHAYARARFAELFRTRTAAEWERIINEEIGAPTGLCQTTEEWLWHDRHARAVGAVVEVHDSELGPTAQAGFPITLSKTPPRVRGPRRPLDGDREEILAELESLPNPTRAPLANEREPWAALEGVFAVDISQVLAGPTATRILAEYGADVTKVMSPYDGQVLAHQYTNNGKQSILLDLKTTRGKEIYHELASGCDVVQENFTRGVAERMLIGERHVREHNPFVVYSGVSTYGQEGHRGGWRGREELGQSVTGMQMRWGGEERPRMQPFALNDYGAGNYSAFGIMVALYHRMRTGEGQRVHTSLAHACTFHQLPFMIGYDGHVWDEPAGQQAVGWGPTDRIYQAMDRWFYLAAASPRDRGRLRRVRGLEDVDFDSVEALAQAFAREAAGEWVERLRGAGVGAHVVLKIEEVMENSIVYERGLSLVEEFPTLGAMRMIGPSGRLSVTPPRPGVPVGPPGAEARRVLTRLGLDAEFEKLVDDHIVYTELPPGVELVGRMRIRT
jgi:crotonobetainyl-CoA:carnitine CoA-transferase CaiB-like acyl-CoA transferase